MKELSGSELGELRSVIMGVNSLKAIYDTLYEAEGIDSMQSLFELMIEKLNDIPELSVGVSIPDISGRTEFREWGAFTNPIP